MDMMKAVAVVKDGLADVKVPRPQPGERDLLVRVQAVAVNPVDTIQQPAETGQAPRVIGWDVAGVVEEVGPKCTLFRPGDEVYYAGDITRPGGFSEYHVVDERIVGRKPKTLSFAEAAALPLTSLTAWEGLFEHLGISKQGMAGERVLIVGAAGGVGSIATQLANRAGLTVIGTASRPESRDWVLAHGAHHVVVHGQAFEPQLSELGLYPVDYVFCLNEVHTQWDNMLSALRPKGRICTILPPREPLNFRPMADKSVTWSIEAMFTRAKYRTPDMDAQHRALSQLANWIDAGEIRTTLAERRSPICAAQVNIAFAKLRSRRTIGKIVLEGFQD
ncbi:NADPH:quinone reductase [Alicyclobacillus contaminans]|uniref:zinc-binding alcohol dehydrogenase family protein n=1 Tax=Alicyclobacillus contaminans TaxID=392016 RepID=UPI00041B7EB5|nr:zinc-binding alcohol dehydrogenase family protein [Alicyclobacillus contaminans]GMA51356.1 NADPH:quinone reductase [Alicyclobacillus contaminans]